MRRDKCTGIGCCMIALALLFTALPTFAEDAASTAIPISIDEEAFRGVPWELTLAETAEMEGVRKHTRTVIVSTEVMLYDMEVKNLTYRFTDDVMVAREFTLKKNSKDVYTLLLYSLLLRYGMPISATDKQAVWQVDVLNITLKRGDALTITYLVNRKTP